MNTSMDKLFHGMFGRIENGKCRLSLTGDIAVKTSNGYKSYNLKTKRLTNCSQFVFNIGEELFFVIPTNKVAEGDIILVGNGPKCVIKAEDNLITAIDYETSEVKQILPERHIFMGSTYFYGKIVSMFGNTNFMKGQKGISKIMQFMMMNEMMKGMTSNSSGNNSFANMLPMMMFMGGGNSMFGDFSNMFDGMFGFDEDESNEDKTEESSVVDAEVVEEGA